MTNKTLACLRIHTHAFLCVLCPRLLHDRELDLYDGTRLLRWDRYQTLKDELQFSDEQLKERYIHTPTHTQFDQ